MTKFSSSQKTWRRRWPLLGLLLVVLMLGHDALMASEAIAASQEMGAATHHTLSFPGYEDVLPAHHDSAPLPQHPKQCSVGFVALTRSADDAAGIAHLPLPVTLVAVSVFLAPDRDRACMWEEPHWPPGMRRALWQVYRI